MAKLVECVPNFSEGEDASLIDDIAASVKTAKVLNIHSDPDHNRSVVAMIGAPDGIAQAAFDMTERAMQLLDIHDHKGVHPFIGVMDVIPFIPLLDCTKKEACDIAAEVGEELWKKLGLPVYYYGDAAIISERKELPNIRRGGFELLQQEIDEPHRMPDVGRGLHPTAGATAIGVRDFLIAFNVNLATADVDIAKSIAYNIREKTGGIPGVRALGLELTSRKITQVSINITRCGEAGLKLVYDEVFKWSKEYGVEIIESELVGMIPQAAVFAGMREYLKLSNYSDNLIIEKHFA